MQLQTRDFRFTFPSVLIYREHLFIHLCTFVSCTKPGANVSKKHTVLIDIVGLELGHQI